MKHTQKGFIAPLVIIIVVVLLLGIGICIWNWNYPNGLNILKHWKSETPSVVDSSTQNSSLDTFSGTYEFSEINPGHPDMVAVYKLTLQKDPQTRDYIADIDVDGFQILERLHAIGIMSATKMSVVFNSYNSSDSMKLFKNGDTLFDLELQPVTENKPLKITWDKMRPNFEGTDIHSSFFVKMNSIDKFISTSTIQSKDQYAGWNTYINKRYGYSIRYPLDMQVDPRSSENDFTQRGLIANNDFIGGDTTISNNLYTVWLMVYKIDPNTTYDQFVSEKHFMFDTKEQVEIGKINAVKLTGTSEFDEPVGATAVNTLIKVGGQMFVVNYSGNPITQQQKNISEQIVNSIFFMTGLWQDAPSVGSGYTNIYQFFSSGTFNYRVAEGACTERQKGVSGYWDIIDRDTLQLKDKLSYSLVGGVEQANPSCGNGKEIIGGTLKSQPVNTSRSLTIARCGDPKVGHYQCLSISGRQFYKLSSDPLISSDLPAEPFKNSNLTLDQIFQEVSSQLGLPNKLIYFRIWGQDRVQYNYGPGTNFAYKLGGKWYLVGKGNSQSVELCTDLTAVPTQYNPGCYDVANSQSKYMNTNANGTATSVNYPPSQMFSYIGQ